MDRLAWILGVSVLLLHSSCAVQAPAAYRVNEYMTIHDPEKEFYPSEGKALLIVERTSVANLAAYAIVVWDVSNRSDPSLIGYLGPTMKSAYEMYPGEHILIAQLAATTNAMKVTVEAGKTYFTKVSASNGYSVYFLPVKADQPNYITRTNISEANPNLVAWGTDRERIENSLQRRIDKGLGKRAEMSPEKMERRNMVEADHR